MDDRQRINQIIKQIEELLRELRIEIGRGALERKASPVRRTRSSGEAVIDERELTEASDALKISWRQRGRPAVEEFVEEKTKEFLKAFCRVNGLSVDFRGSKKDLARAIEQQLAESAAISKEVKLSKNAKLEGRANRLPTK